MVSQEVRLRRIALLEVTGLLFLAEAMIWGLSPRTSCFLGAALFLGLILIISIHILCLSPRLYPDTLAVTQGLKSWRLTKPIRLEGKIAYATMLMSGVAGIYVLGQNVSQAISPEWDTVPIKLARYLVWATVQTYLYFIFFRPRMLLILGPGRPATDQATIMALMYALIHLPNPYTMTGSALAGFFWSLLYVRHPSFAWVAFSHAMFGTCVQVFTDWPIRTGPSFLDQDHYAFRLALKKLFFD